MAVLIIGASLAGIRTAQALRAGGHDGAITVVGEEPHHPYDRPPLSKAGLAVDAPETVVPLLAPEELGRLGIDLRLGTRATSLDVAGRIVTTDGDATGRLFDFDELVIATGVRPRRLPGIGSTAGVHTLRTADDARDLRAALDRAEQVVVIGAGFIGAEFASAARERGAAVSIVETQAVPMAHLFGEQVGGMLAALHTAHGVEVHAGAAVAGVLGDHRVSGVALTDGRVLPADLVVVGIGAEPATDWLGSSGLPIDDGVVCDADLRVRGHRHIYAAGDVARFHHPLYGADLRIEHWTNANDHAAVVAAGILGRPAPAFPVPYVWSDQYGRKIQIVGRPAAGTLRAVRGSVADGPSLAAVYADTDGVAVGGLVVDDPRLLMTLRKEIFRRTAADDIDLGVTVRA